MTEQLRNSLNFFFFFFGKEIKVSGLLLKNKLKKVSGFDQIFI